MLVLVISPEPERRPLSIFVLTLNNISEEAFSVGIIGLEDTQRVENSLLGMMVEFEADGVDLFAVGFVPNSVVHPSFVFIKSQSQHTES